MATVLAMAVGDEQAEAVLHLFSEDDEWASLDAGWGDFAGATAIGSEYVSSRRWIS